jgi:hypothetical protein
MAVSVLRIRHYCLLVKAEIIFEIRLPKTVIICSLFRDALGNYRIELGK